MAEAYPPKEKDGGVEEHCGLHGRDDVAEAVVVLLLIRVGLVVLLNTPSEAVLAGSCFVALGLLSMVQTEPAATNTVSEAELLSLLV